MTFFANTTSRIKTLSQAKSRVCRRNSGMSCKAVLQVVGVAQSFCEVWETVAATLAFYKQTVYL